MCDSNNNKLGGVNSRFASSASEILRIHEVAVHEDTQRAMKSGLKGFKGKKKFADIRLSSCLRSCPWHLHISSYFILQDC